jgi:hypothetical protein
VEKVFRNTLAFLSFQISQDISIAKEVTVFPVGLRL